MIDQEQYDIVKGAMDETTKRISVAFYKWMETTYEWMNNVPIEESYNHFYNEIIKPTCKNAHPDVSANSIQTEPQQ